MLFVLQDPMELGRMVLMQFLSMLDYALTEHYFWTKMHTSCTNVRISFFENKYCLLSLSLSVWVSLCLSLIDVSRRYKNLLNSF